LSFEYGYPRPPKIDILDRIFLKTLGRIWAHSASFRKNINYIPNGKVLDVGCGNGELLDRFAQLGWETYGTEICRESAIVAEEGGHKIAHGTLTEIQYPQDTFDAITLWDTLEHIHNPRETLEEIWRICRPGGSVYIYVPNFGSLYGRILRDRWFMFTAPIHYFHYTEQTLVSLLNGCGFELARLHKPFGDVGLRHSTIPGLNRKFGDVADAVGLGVFFRLLDRILPNGHLLAHVIKNKK
jgi:SAM-dependent methyltransferase